MHFVNHRNRNKKLPFSEGILNTLSSDGGLLVPASFPQAPPANNQSFAEYAGQILALFTKSDPFSELTEACAHAAFSFAPKIQPVGENHFLELFHGPSLSFKDFGAQFLAQYMSRLPHKKERLILVATSGDTGSAVAAAYHNIKNVRVVILFPKEGVSARQAHQLSCWGDNILTLAVDGSFDDCQRIVKHILTHSESLKEYELTTANSINIGRLLPQVAYYAYASHLYQSSQSCAANIVVPSGNLGNVTACCWARAMGCPIDKIVIAQNSNRSVVDYEKTGVMEPKPSIPTLANAMDVGNPSNFQRLLALYPSFSSFKSHLRATSARDDDIKRYIELTYLDHQYIICPHTAAAVYATNTGDYNQEQWLIAATAHPSKFETIVEPLIGKAVPVPEALANQLALKSLAIDTPATVRGVVDAIKARAD